ncbi:DNA replication ATP-dependent helicase Dna2 [Halarchaeum rubridurum]|uniref:DNA helicase n=1 Tax=Halarchaeum rubridurum TaxID=489911 RepID=A0A830FXP8_9EURY|nr:AAA domain-containing protein [Halarchaeum rubridurum]MBP1953687.1 DNA replication ATP-dependent helicase Dna2 [Halarchaeum rubridurum]GGM53929.1 ATPase AAA [Halarchaeum rubridurum]
MTIRGDVTAVGDGRTVSTQYGERDLVEVTVEPGDAPPRTLTLWGKWTETADYLEPGMELLLTDPEEREWNGETQYATSKGSYVVVEPDYLVDVTDIREWVQCPRQYYLSKLSGLPLKYPVAKGTLVHEVFGDLLRGRDLEAAIDDAVDDAGLELGLLGEDPESVREEVHQHAAAIEGWLNQGLLTEDSAADAASSERAGWHVDDDWRSEYTLISDTFGIKGRCDAIRRGMPVELKTGKNTNRDPRFHDKIQAACYALMLEERGVEADTGTLLYTKNAAVDRAEESGDLSPAKEFSIGPGLLEFVVRSRNRLAAMEHDMTVPTGKESNAKCEYCFSQDACMVVSGRLNQESKAGQIGSMLPEDERDYFEELYEAVEAERREIHAEYAKLWKQSPEERADDDRAVIDLDPDGREELVDGRWRLRARRPAAASSKIREGDRVLASDGDPVHGTAEMGRVERLDEERVVVTTDEPLTLRRLDVYPSELSVSRMLTALHDFVLKGDDRRKDVLFGRAEPSFSDETRDVVPNNEAQNAAVNRALNAEDFALIHGPPGTGKTYTIATLVREFVARGERVLLSAFTNRAVDNALEAVEEQGVTDVVRVGTETGVREDMREHRLENAGGPHEQADRLGAASLVAATTATCGSRVMRSQSFDVVLVDEASQLTEPGALAALNRGARFVLVGDHHQLPPVVQAGGRLTTSLFERLIDEHPEAGVLLESQYRMRQRIQAFSSTEFYGGKLRPASGEVATQSLADLGVSTENVVDGVGFEQVTGTTDAHVDPAEAERVAEVVADYRAAGLDAGQIGVIAPFRAQVGEIGRRVPEGVAVDTVDRFQGSAKEVIVVSFVATGSLDGPIFEDYRRLNVALSRAKKALVLVGDSAALSSDDFYARMLNWARR